MLKVLKNYHTGINEINADFELQDLYRVNSKLKKEAHLLLQVSIYLDNKVHPNQSNRFKVNE